MRRLADPAGSCSGCLRAGGGGAARGEPAGALGRGAGRWGPDYRGRHSHVRARASSHSLQRPLCAWPFSQGCGRASAVLSQYKGLQRACACLGIHHVLVLDELPGRVQP